jgi:hypothetical protein
LWQSFVSEISKLNSPNSIQIHRSGQEYRSDFTALQDWLPHDLYLLESLLTKLDISGEHIVVARGLTSTQTSIIVADNLRISISFTASNHRQMIWSIATNHGSKFVIDFLDSSISEYDGETVLSKESFADDHPLVNMLEQFLIDIQRPSENDLPIMQEIVARNFQDCDLRFG